MIKVILLDIINQNKSIGKQNILLNKSFYIIFKNYILRLNKICLSLFILFNHHIGFPPQLIGLPTQIIDTILFKTFDCLSQVVDRFIEILFQIVGVPQILVPPIELLIDFDTFKQILNSGFLFTYHILRKTQIRLLSRIIKNIKDFI